MSDKAGDAEGNRTSSGIVIAGGELDLGVFGADIYLSAPQEADAPPGKACQMAKRYVDLVNQGESAQIAALFEADAVQLDQLGKCIRGADQMEAYFAAVGQLSPRVVAVAYVGNDVDCMVELAVELRIGDRSRYVLTSVDHFTLGENGKVCRLVAFGRPFGEQWRRETEKRAHHDLRND